MKLSRASCHRIGRFVVSAILCILASGLSSRAETTKSNLIVGGDGEAGACSDDPRAVTTIPGWTVLKGSPSLLCHTAADSLTPRDGHLGKGFLAGGPYGDSALMELIDVSSAQAAIDAGSTTFTLSGWLGGQGGDRIAAATLTIRFLGALGQPKGVASLPRAAAIAGDDRNQFLEESISNTVPAGTRSISVMLQFAGTENHLNSGCADNLSLTLSTPVKNPALGAPPSSVPTFDHVFLVMMENTTYDEVVGDERNAPFINRLIAQGTLLTNASATYHPSDQNYLAIAGGAAFAKGATYFPDIKVQAKNIGDNLEAAGKTWKGYAQGMGIPCGTSNQYDPYFEADDLPFINFTDIRENRERCKAHLVDASELRGDLLSPQTTPNFVWLAADDYYDGEASFNEGGLAKSLQVQDQWLQETLTPLFGSPAWKEKKTLLILTWDESHSGEFDNHIATVLVGSQGKVRAGYLSNTHANHYNVARTIEEALGIPPLTSNDKYAQPLNDAFLQPSLNDMTQSPKSTDTEGKP
jgi:Phosphoesterase family